MQSYKNPIIKLGPGAFSLSTQFFPSLLLVFARKDISKAILPILAVMRLEVTMKGQASFKVVRHPVPPELEAKQAAPAEKKREPKPPWLKVKAPSGGRYEEIRNNLKSLKLSTVCQEARCPNIAECWGGGTATIMVMGDTCTRGCRFCAVKSAKNPAALDPMEPYNTAQAVAAMGVDYIVITSVDRDDIPDGGASHFAAVIREIRKAKPEVLVEVLIPDFQGQKSGVEAIIDAGPDVVAHNLETTRTLTRKVRDRRANFDQSLGVLKYIKEYGRGRGRNGVDIVSKTSFMLGLSETDEDIHSALVELRDIDCDVVTFGQYLRPSQKHLEVVEYVPPEKFKMWDKVSRELGFLYVASGPLVRSSYRAGEYYLKAHLEKKHQENSRA